MTQRPKLGVLVTARAIAIVTPGQKRKWKREECKQFSGVFVGVRFKANGFVRNDNIDWSYQTGSPHYFERSETVEVWLVAKNMYHNPVCVFPSDVKIAEGSTEWR